MIQKVNEKCREKIMDYLKAEKAINLFITGGMWSMYIR